jgi:hypothetical protein
MPSHPCLDPHDHYAQDEVLVAFQTIERGIRLISALDVWDNDILLDLEDFQRLALESEILDDYRHPDGSGLTPAAWTGVFPTPGEDGAHLPRRRRLLGYAEDHAPPPRGKSLRASVRRPAARAATEPTSEGAPPMPRGG